MSKITAQQERLQGDLRGLIEGEVRCDEAAIRMYSTDAGLFECGPLGVVFPRNRDDVAACVRYAGEHGISIHARGAGTGRAGAALGHGIVLDFTKHMRRVLYVSDGSVTVQPGAILERVNSQLVQSQGQMIGPDPGFAPATTIGSMLAVDGAGTHWLSRGFPRQVVRKLQVVLANGELVNIERGENVVPDTSFAGHLSRELGKYFSLTSVSKAVEHQAELCRNEFPWRYGYRICDAVQPDGRANLLPLLLGSEGTLGIITQAEIETIAAPKSSGIALFLFDLLDNAMQAIPIIRAYHPASCELIDRRRITLLRDWDARFKSFLPLDAEAILAVEIEGNDHLAVGDRIHDLINELRFDRQLCYTTRVAFQTNDLALFRDLVAKSQFALYRMQHYLSGISRFEDTAVPVDSLSAHITAIQNLFKRHELAPSFFGHVGHGQIGVQPVLNLSTAEALTQIRRVTPEYYDEVLKRGGSISSEQAFGWARSPFVPLQHSGYYSVYEQVKKYFDPKGLLNPGKIISRHDSPPLEYRSPIVPVRKLADVALYGQTDSTDTPNNMPYSASEPDDTNTADTSPSNGGPLQNQLEVQLKWDPSPIYKTTMRCNGCGVCRNRKSDTRMCPIFRRDLSEESVPRAKANLMRGVIDGQSDLSLLTTEQSKNTADYCVHCHMCRLDCPAEVDMPRIAFQSKCAFTAAHGISLSDRFFSNIDNILKYVSLVSCPINWTVTNRWTRWLYEKTFGLSQARKLPKLAKISYLSRAIWYKRLAKPSRRRDRKVALFVDVYTNHFDPRIAEAAVKVLEHNGIDVHVPGRQQASGMFAIACGNRDRAEKLARQNTALLADVIRQGYHVVTIEPTSAICLKEEYGYMSDDADTTLVAANTSDIMSYLHQLHLSGKLQLDFSPLSTTIGYHAPCRSLALEHCNLSEQTAAERLLRLVPGLAVKRLESGCCGLAGAYGMLEKNFRMSLRIGMPLFSALRNPTIQIGASECNLCKMQMEQGCNKRTLHPVVLLAHAYGFLPEIEPLLRSW